MILPTSYMKRKSNLNGRRLWCKLWCFSNIGNFGLLPHNKDKKKTWKYNRGFRWNSLFQTIFSNIGSVMSWNSDEHESKAHFQIYKKFKIVKSHHNMFREWRKFCPFVDPGTTFRNMFTTKKFDSIQSRGFTT